MPTLTPQTKYRIGRVGYVLGVVAALFVGVRGDAWALVAAGAALLAGFVPASRWFAARVGYARSDERTRRRVETAASRALIALYAVAVAVYLAGAALDATGDLTGSAATLHSQASVVLGWTAAAVVASSLAHGVADWRRHRRLEG